MLALSPPWPAFFSPFPTSQQPCSSFPHWRRCGNIPLLCVEATWCFSFVVSSTVCTSVPFPCLFAAIDHQSRIWAIGALRLAFSLSPHIFPWPAFNISASLRICASLEDLPLHSSQPCCIIPLVQNLPAPVNGSAFCSYPTIDRALGRCVSLISFSARCLSHKQPSASGRSEKTESSRSPRSSPYRGVVFCRITRSHSCPSIAIQNAKAV